MTETYLVREAEFREGANANAPGAWLRSTAAMASCPMVKRQLKRRNMVGLCYNIYCYEDATRLYDRAECKLTKCRLRGHDPKIHLPALGQ